MNNATGEDNTFSIKKKSFLSTSGTPTPLRVGAVGKVPMTPFSNLLGPQHTALKPIKTPRGKRP